MKCNQENGITTIEDLITSGCNPNIFECFMLGIMIIVVSAIIIAVLYGILIGLPRLHAMDEYNTKNKSFWQIWWMGAKFIYLIYTCCIAGLGVITGIGCAVIYFF